MHHERLSYSIDIAMSTRETDTTEEGGEGEEGDGFHNTDVEIQTLVDLEEGRMGDVASKENNEDDVGASPPQRPPMLLAGPLENSRNVDDSTPTIQTTNVSPLKDEEQIIGSIGLGSHPSGRKHHRVQLSLTEDPDEHWEVVSPLVEDALNVDHAYGGTSEDHFKSPVHYQKNRRASMVLDLESGREGGSREHRVRLRSVSTSNPVRASDRRNHALVKFFHTAGSLRHVTAEDGVDAEVELAGHEQEARDEEMKTSMHGRLLVSAREVDQTVSVHRSKGRLHQTEVSGANLSSGVRQYRLEAVATPKKFPTSPHRFLLTCCGCTQVYNIYDDPNSGRNMRSKWTANAMVIRYFHWSFRSNFFAVFWSATIVYFVIVTIFALMIWVIAVRHPTCIRGPPGFSFEKQFFSDVWQLSWTTFATVGYGAISTSVSSSIDGPHYGQCTGMIILVSLEAYCGMLFGSMFCAILFARVSRVQSNAQVAFSVPIVVRYGRGVQDSRDSDGEDNEDTGPASQARLGAPQHHFPCPVLEFRLVNRNFGVPGGEIMDATVSAVASIDANQACPSVRSSALHRRRSKRGNKRGGPRLLKSRSAPEGHLLSGSIFGKDSFRKHHKRQPAKSNYVDEDPTGKVVPKRIFTKLDVEPPGHPFFKRVWVVSHTLDQNSPLLKSFAREMVVRSGGYWPPQLNHPEGVRSAVHFEQVLVSMSGTSNADAKKVYAQKVYDRADVSVGYRFVNMLYRDLGDASLQVDLRLMNDVTEQAGGGGEPLHCEEQEMRNFVHTL